MTRSESRESAFVMIFESLFRDDSPEEIITLADEVDEINVSPDAIKMFEGTLSHTEELDSIISKYSEKRQIDRIAKVNIAVLRLALYEILYDDKVPMNAAISEAVLISKEFSQPEDVAFVNGILGAYSRSGEVQE